MNPMAISWIMFACVFGGALLGMVLRAPGKICHLRDEDVIAQCDTSFVQASRSTV